MVIFVCRFQIITDFSTSDIEMIKGKAGNKMIAAYHLSVKILCKTKSNASPVEQFHLTHKVLYK
jgi:hypothetical protein